MKTHLEVLREVDTRIEKRNQDTQAAHPFWPCSKGCDLCCRSLPHLPKVTHAEWERVAEAIAILPDREHIHAVIRAGGTHEGTKVVCPLLDETTGLCRVYEARPIACRTYGFYTERDAGLHCNLVTEAVRAHDALVVWGNGEAVAQDLAPLGAVRGFREWLLGEAR